MNRKELRAMIIQGRVTVSVLRLCHNAAQDHEEAQVSWKYSFRSSSFEVC
jgi:hypothetical protein